MIWVGFISPPQKKEFSINSVNHGCFPHSNNYHNNLYLPAALLLQTPKASLTETFSLGSLLWLSNQLQ